MQGKKFLLAVVAGCVFGVLATSASAMMSVPNGWYIEANAGSTNLSNKNYPGSASTSGIGGNANIGYKFMPYFATEIGYSQYANSSIKDISTGTKAGNDKHYAYDLAAKGILPIVDSGFEAFAKVGVTRVGNKMSINSQTAATAIGLSSSSHSDTGIYLGVGGQYYFMPELAVVVQWQRAQGNSSTGTLDLVSGGLSFILD